MKKTIVMLAVATLFSGTYASAKTTSNAVAKTLVASPVNAGISTFCKAIVQGDVATVTRLIELGEDVNQKSLGMAPVHYAARYNKAEILQVLVANGADIRVKCDKGHTAKKYAELSNAEAALAVVKNAMKV